MLSILIVNWNTRDLLCACLASIDSHPPTTAFEVIVVDNASTDGSVEKARQSFPSVRVIASEVNSGYAAGNNLAFGSSHGEWVLTLNPDTEVYEGTLDAAVARLSSDSGAGWLGIRQVDAKDGSTQASVRGFPSVRGILGALTGMGRIVGGAWDSYELSRFDYDKPQRAPQPMGTFLLLRRKALESLENPQRPFDERFPIFFNEVDLLYRLQKGGWHGLYAPDIRILHHGGESTKQVRKPMIWESHNSLTRYFRKHFGTGLARLGLPFLAAIVWAAAFLRAKGHHAGFRA